MKALVLSGGNLRFFWHIGAFKELARRGWRPDVVYGASAGAIAGSLLMAYLNKYSATEDPKIAMHSAVGQLLLLVDEIRKPADLIDRHWFPPMQYVNALRGKGMFTLDPLKALLTEYIGRSFIPNAMVSVTNLLTGAVSIHGANVETIIASASLPVLTPLHAGVYCDGGVLLNAPLKPAIDAGADEIVVLVTSPKQCPQCVVQHAKGPAIFSRTIDVIMHRMLLEDIRRCRSKNEKPGYKTIDLTDVFVTRNLPPADITKFTPADTEILIRCGELDCRQAFNNKGTKLKAA